MRIRFFRPIKVIRFMFKIEDPVRDLVNDPIIDVPTVTQVDLGMKHNDARAR
jgi:hypothetical protein